MNRVKSVFYRNCFFETIIWMAGKYLLDFIRRQIGNKYVFAVVSLVDLVEEISI